MSDMGNIKTKHEGGDKARMPSTGKGGHPIQKPGNADKNKCSEMRWAPRDKGYK